MVAAKLFEERGHEKTDQGRDGRRDTSQMPMTLRTPTGQTTYHRTSSMHHSLAGAIGLQFGFAGVQPAGQTGKSQEFNRTGYAVARPQGRKARF